MTTPDSELCMQRAEHWPSREQADAERSKWNEHLRAIIDLPGYDAPASGSHAGAHAPHRRLDGMTVCVKDNTDVAGMPTSGGTAIWGDAPAERDAESIGRLIAAGASVVGKSNLHELAHGPTTANIHLGVCHNPWDSARIPGGSSGGTAAAVASGMCAAGIGTDTNGSVLIPSSCCGLTGFRPPLGSVSTSGVVPLSSRFDTVGPIAHTVQDVARMYAEMSFPPAPCHCAVLEGIEPRGSRPLEDVKIGLLRTFWADVEPEVAEIVSSALEELVAAGAQVVDIDGPSLASVGPSVRTVTGADATLFHGELIEQHGPQLDPETLRRLKVGASVGYEEYFEALASVRNWAATVGKILTRDVDLLLAPTLPALVPLSAEPVQEISSKASHHTVAFAGASLTAMTLPAGFVDGVPVGMTLATRPGLEFTAFRVGAAFQERTDFHDRRPTLDAYLQQTAEG